ncbi:LacI family DNA-binding transcriptional regulator [Novosphingobium sp.]|jgi:LacI family transcriptional regulator|uniref:LacI family DNA-binding transcriptional regulator n=1 Tax=Novosphingobium sp. TaxID=1874826 RepID=UPI003D6CD3BD
MKAPEARSPGGEPTIDDVAAAAGVSIRTVSRVLNKSPKVNENTRKTIEDIIDRLNFKPSRGARALAMRRSFLIGLVHNDQNALVLDSIQRGIARVASPNGYELVVHACPDQDDAVIDDVLAFIDRSRVDGIILLPPVSGVPGLPEALDTCPVTAVALSSIPIEGFAGVVLSEERQAGAEVARHLLGLGHRALGLVNGPEGVASAQERRTGFLGEIANQAGISLAETSGDYSFASGVLAAEDLLSREPRPTAIFAANDIMAAGVMKVAATRRIAVPGQLSIVGFDGSILTRMLTPALTSVLRPFGEMAAGAAGQLIARIEGKTAAPTMPHALELVPAESTGPAPA